MAEFTSEVLPLTGNPIWNDASFFFMVAVFALVQVLIVVGVYIKRHFNNRCIVDHRVTTSSVDSVYHVKRAISKSVHPVKDEDLYTEKSQIKECTETHEQILFPSRYEPKAVTRQDPVLTDWGSNLRLLNNVNDTTNNNLKAKPPDSCLQDTNGGLEKGTTSEALFAEQFRPAECTIIVYPVSDTDPSETINGTQGMEEEENDGILRRTTGDSTDNNDSRPVISSDIANQLTEISPEQASVDGSSEFLGIGTQPRYMYPGYKLQAKRLQTYRRCPYRLQLKKTRLANAGFYFTGLRDCTKCFCCGGGLEKWEAEDDPWIEHARWFPNCRFVIRNKQQWFVDLVQDTLRHSQTKNIPQLTPHQQRQVSRQQNSELQQRQQYNSTSRTELHGLDRMTVPRVISDLTGNYSVSGSLPRYPQYADVASRSNTFRGTDSLDDPQMAEAGFFCKARGLLVCFHCGGHLYTWKPGDNLWIEHVRWFPNCSYLKAKRGQSFIADVQSRLEKFVNVEMTNTTFSQYPQRISLQTRRHNNLETSNPQSPTVARHISHQDRPVDSADETNEDTRAENVWSEYQQHPGPSVDQAQPQPRPSIARTQHQTIPTVAQIQQQPRPSVAQTEYQPRPSVAQTQHQPIPSVDQAQHQPTPSAAQIQQQPRSSVAQTLYQPGSSVAQIQQQPLPFRIQAQENQISLSQSVTVENGQINPLRPNIISNRNTEQVNLHRTVYAARVTRNTQTGQVVQSYQWDLLCRKCQERAADVMCVPCGHMVCCRRCGRRERACPVCHRFIDGIEQ
ncbi:uncharacterized protein LOC110456458 [Mizuhopecten yessoensis]|nr:uncharacterized protein LOC110456458 [Mizuhopecten yessoensis]